MEQIHRQEFQKQHIQQLQRSKQFQQYNKYYSDSSSSSDEEESEIFQYLKQKYKSHFSMLSEINTKQFINKLENIKKLISNKNSIFHNCLSERELIVLEHKMGFKQEIMINKSIEEKIQINKLIKKFDTNKNTNIHNVIVAFLVSIYFVWIKIPDANEYDIFNKNNNKNPLDLDFFVPFEKNNFYLKNEKQNNTKKSMFNLNIWKRSSSINNNPYDDLTRLKRIQKLQVYLNNELLTSDNESVIKIISAFEKNEDFVQELYLHIYDCHDKKIIIPIKISNNYIYINDFVDTYFSTSYDVNSDEQNSIEYNINFINNLSHYEKFLTTLIPCHEI